MKYTHLLFCDVDGTLVPMVTDDTGIRAADAAISMGVRRAISQLEGSGIGVVLASGRTKNELSALHRDLGLELPFISDGGARIVSASEVDLYASSIDPDVLRRVSRIGRSLHLKVRAHRSAGADTSSLWVAGGKIDLQLFVHAIRDFGDIDIWPSHAQNGDALLVVPAGADKGKAAALVSDLLAIPTRCTAGVGDGINDLPLLRTVSLPFWVGAPSPEANAVSALIVPPVEQDGFMEVAKYLVMRKTDDGWAGHSATLEPLAA